MVTMRTVVVTGSASGIGAATKARLEADGQRVIGIDRRDAEAAADLCTAAGRRVAIGAVTERADGAIDGLVTCAGPPGLTGATGSALVSVNYFGSVVLLHALRPLLASGDRATAVAVGSNAATCQPGVPMDVVARCLDGDEAAARDAADVAPGAVETPLLKASREDPTIGRFVDEFPVPVGRNASAGEIAALVAFLLGPDARYFCGSVVYLDGGTDALLRADDFPLPMGG